MWLNPISYPLDGTYRANTIKVFYYFAVNEYPPFQTGRHPYFALAIRERANCACDIFPNFETEILYAEYFFAYLSELPGDANTDIIPAATEKFSKYMNSCFRDICKVLDKYQVDRTNIFEIISKEKLIPKKDRSGYNRQLTGKYPKGLKTKEWENYNHWALVNAY
jgi:hypothetical protein